jgi:hypothetical protein
MGAFLIYTFHQRSNNGPEIKEWEIEMSTVRMWEANNEYRI